LVLPTALAARRGGLPTHGILTPDEAYVSKTEPMRLAA
jgi:hypothetical protein